MYISLFDILQQIWGSARKTHIESLFIVQNRALRIIRSPSEPFFRQLRFLNCENIVKYLVGRLMYRVYHGELSTLQFQIYICMIVNRRVIIINQYAELILEKVVYNTLVLGSGT